MARAADVRAASGFQAENLVTPRRLEETWCDDLVSRGAVVNSVIRTFAGLEFVPKAENIVFIGPMGNGRAMRDSAFVVGASTPTASPSATASRR